MTNDGRYGLKGSLYKSYTWDKVNLKGRFT